MTFNSRADPDRVSLPSLSLPHMGLLNHTLILSLDFGFSISSQMFKNVRQPSFSFIRQVVLGLRGLTVFLRKTLKVVILYYKIVQPVAEALAKLTSPIFLIFY